MKKHTIVLLLLLSVLTGCHAPSKQNSIGNTQSASLHTLMPSQNHIAP